MTSVINPEVPFPANESYGMQQAWRLMYDKSNIATHEIYTINRDYPVELQQLRGRYYTAVGINVKTRSFTPQQQNHVNNMFDDMDNSSIVKYYNSHPKLTITSACVCAVGFSGAVIFFLSSIPLFLAIGILTICIGAGASTLIC
jgi:hypothetical protein